MKNRMSSIQFNIRKDNNKKKLIGKAGEDRVAGHLKADGWKILERNFRYHKKEVDIIACKDDIITFVEVKTRKSVEFGLGLEAVDKHKRRNILGVARYYIELKKLHDFNVRFDVASIYRTSFLYIEDAFQA